MAQHHLVQLAACAALLVSLSSARAVAQQVTLASAAMGTTGKFGGTSITTAHFSGWRFQIDTPLDVDRVGGHLLSDLFLAGDVFAALVSLDSINSFPHGSPFTEEEVIAVTTFRPPFPSDAVMTPLNAHLNPGSYALVYGSGLYGATSGAALPLLDDQLDIPPTTIDSYIFWAKPSANDPPLWRTHLAQRMRFVVEAHVPIPGDYDHDGNVDEQDYDVWNQDFGSAQNLAADGNGNGAVDTADYTIWRDHEGVTSAVGAGQIAVPEPSAAILLTATLAWAIVVRKNTVRAIARS